MNIRWKLKAFYITEHFIFEENWILAIVKFLTRAKKNYWIKTILLLHLAGSRLLMIFCWEKSNSFSTSLKLDRSSNKRYLRAVNKCTRNYQTGCWKNWSFAKQWCRIFFLKNKKILNFNSANSGVTHFCGMRALKFLLSGRNLHFYKYQYPYL